MTINILYTLCTGRLQCSTWVIQSSSPLENLGKDQPWKLCGLQFMHDPQVITRGPVSKIIFVLTNCATYKNEEDVSSYQRRPAIKDKSGFLEKPRITQTNADVLSMKWITRRPVKRSEHKATMDARAAKSSYAVIFVLRLISSFCTLRGIRPRMN